MIYILLYRNIGSWRSKVNRFTRLMNDSKGNKEITTLYIGA